MIKEDSQPLATYLLQPGNKQRRIESTGRTMTVMSVGILLLVMISIVYFIASKGLATFFADGISIRTFFSTEWNLSQSLYGALPFMAGSFAVTLLAALLAAPLGIGAAVFMTEVAPSWGQKILQPVIELLVGIPSVVYGFVGLIVIVPFIRETLGGGGFSLLAGVVVLTIMILPTVTSIATDTLNALPRELREASYALGATRWQTIRRVLLKVSLPGLMTGVVLGMARAFGEALAVQMVIGNTPVMPTSLLEPMATLTSVITLNMGHTVAGSTENNVLWSMAFILLLMTLLFIFLIRLLTRRREDV